MTLKRLLAATVLLVMAPVAAAHAQGVEGIRSATLFVGTGLSLAGNAINEGVGTIDGKPSVLVEQALSNHFSDALRLRFTGSLGLDYNKEAFATFAYGKYNGTERIVGSVSGFPSWLDCPMPTPSTSKAASATTCGPRVRFAPTWPGHPACVFFRRRTRPSGVVEVGLTLDNLPYFKGRRC